MNLLVADSGSVLTSVAVPIAKEHKMFLFDVSGTGGTFFTKDNPYIALMADPVSTIWPKYIADLPERRWRRRKGIKTVAILYATNDFTSTQANAVRGFIQTAGKLKIVYDQGVPTSTSNYTVLINNIAAAKPDAVAAARVSPATTSPSCATCRIPARSSASCSASTPARNSTSCARTSASTG